MANDVLYAIGHVVETTRQLCNIARREKIDNPATALDSALFGLQIFETDNQITLNLAIIDDIVNRRQIKFQDVISELRNDIRISLGLKKMNVKPHQKQTRKLEEIVVSVSLSMMYVLPALFIVVATILKSTEISALEPISSHFRFADAFAKYTTDSDEIGPLILAYKIVIVVAMIILLIQILCIPVVLRVASKSRNSPWYGEDFYRRTNARFAKYPFGIYGWLAVMVVASCAFYFVITGIDNQFKERMAAYIFMYSNMIYIALNVLFISVFSLLIYLMLFQLILYLVNTFLSNKPMAK